MFLLLNLLNDHCIAAFQSEMKIWLKRLTIVYWKYDAPKWIFLEERYFNTVSGSKYNIFYIYVI